MFEDHPYLPLHSHKAVADKALKDFVKATKALSLTFYVRYGTALGFWRDKQYIIYDNDIDIVVYANKNEWKQLVKYLEKLGFNHSLEIENAYAGWFERNRIMLDVENTTKKPPAPFKRFDKTSYGGIQFNLPHPIEKYLAYYYGDWKTPILRQNHKGFVPRTMSLTDFLQNK